VAGGKLPAWRAKEDDGLAVLWWFRDSTLGPANGAPSRRNPGWRRGVGRHRPDFKHGVAMSPVMVDDGWLLISDRRQLSDSTRSCAVRQELGGCLREEEKSDGTLPRRWSYKGASRGSRGVKRGGSNLCFSMKACSR
jgi:hypothetical protein